jgi:hypothetical protein
MNFYRVEFNDFGLDYAVGKSFDKAGQKIIDFYGNDTKIKKVELVGKVADDTDELVVRLHL